MWEFQALHSGVMRSRKMRLPAAGVFRADEVCRHVLHLDAQG